MNSGEIKAFLKERLYHRPLIKKYRLGETRPALPEAVFFEVINRCNSRCAFCVGAVQHERRARQEMPFELYRSVIEQLAAIDYHKRVAYHVTNDPLLFRNLDQFIQYARSRLPRAHLQIMSNGLLLTPKRGEQLIELGIDEIKISFYQKVKGEPIPPNLVQFRDMVLPKYFPRKKGNRHYTADRGKDFVFQINPTYIEREGWSRAGHSPNHSVVDSAIGGVCLYPWIQFNVAGDGRVSKCCADVFFDDPMGNVKDRSFLDIWHGPEFTNVRRTLLKGRRKDLPNCRWCDYFGLDNGLIRNPILKLVKYQFLAGH